MQNGLFLKKKAFSGAFDSYCQRCLLVEDHPGRLVEAWQYLEQQLAIYEQQHLQ
jgi:hypothetical protein